MKKIYLTPEISLREIERVDVIATSSAIGPAVEDNGDTPKVSAFRR